MPGQRAAGGAPPALSITADGRAFTGPGPAGSDRGGGGGYGSDELPATSVFSPHPGGGETLAAAAPPQQAPRRRSLFANIPLLPAAAAARRNAAAAQAATPRTNLFAAFPQMGANLGRAVKRTLSGTGVALPT